MVQKQAESIRVMCGLACERGMREIWSAFGVRKYFPDRELLFDW